MYKLMNIKEQLIESIRKLLTKSVRYKSFPEQKTFHVRCNICREIRPVATCRDYYLDSWRIK